MERWNELQTDRTKGRPTIIAHRGDWRGAPESSVMAIRAAIEHPACDGVEMDVRWSADGVPILLHDESLERTHGVARLAAELTAAELTDLGVATLDQALAIIPGAATVVLDLKELPRPALYESLFRARRQPADDRTVMEAFDSAIHEEARRLAPAWPRWLNVRAPGGPVDEIIARALSLGCRALAVNRTVATAELIRSARAVGLPVIAWTILDRADYDRLKAMGIAGVFIEGPIMEEPVLNHSAGWLGSD